MRVLYYSRQFSCTSITKELHTKQHRLNCNIVQLVLVSGNLQPLMLFFPVFCTYSFDIAFFLLEEKNAFY